MGWVELHRYVSVGKVCILGPLGQGPHDGCLNRTSVCSSSLIEAFLGIGITTEYLKQEGTLHKTNDRLNQ